LEFRIEGKGYFVKKIRSQTRQLAVPGLKNRIFAVALLGIAIALSSGCKKSDDSQTPGQKLDSAIAKTEQAAAEAKVQGEQSGADVKAKTEATFAKAGEALKNATENAESSAKVAANKAINKIDDMAITAAISAELLKDAEIKLFRINVDTKDGAVVLKGNVPTDNVRERAAAIAKTFSGVQSVDNQLVVKAN
jgi:hyperosmotically inducible protein